MAFNPTGTSPSASSEIASKFPLSESSSIGESDCAKVSPTNRRKPIPAVNLH